LLSYVSVFFSNILRKWELLVESNEGGVLLDTDSSSISHEW
jgi:hypothetical protein